MKKLSSVVWQQVVALYRTKSARIVGVEFGISKESVLNAVRRAGEKVRKRDDYGMAMNIKYGRLNPSVRAEIVKAYKTKNSREVAKLFNTSHESVLAIVKEAGGKVRGRGQPSPTKLAEIKKRNKAIAKAYEKESSSSVGAKFNLSVSTVLDAVRAAGGTVRAGSGNTIDVKKRTKIVKAYRNKSLTKVAKQFNVHNSTVLKFVREAGEPAKYEKRKISATLNRKILHMLKNYSLRVVAKKAGVSKRSVSSIKRANRDLL